MSARNRATAERRLLKELKDLRKKGGCEGFSAGPKDDGDDLFKWEVCLFGLPSDSLYAGGVYRLAFDFDETYPFKPPKVRFNTRILHCNVDASGNICLDTLKENWSPVLTVEKVVLSILTLLDSPNEDDPLSISVAELYRSNRPKHDALVRSYVLRYACE